MAHLKGPPCCVYTILFSTPWLLGAANERLGGNVCLALVGEELRPREMGRRGLVFWCVCVKV